jgi:NhaP-type Na+/H+ or K+/H+ antiporter
LSHAESVPELIAFAVVLFAFGLVSKRIDGLPLTAPMVFVAAGLLAGWLGIVDLGFEGHGDGESVEIGTEAARTIAEIALVLLLFTDAARVNLGALRGRVSLPTRLLGIGLPLTIALGGLLAWALFDDELSVAEAFVLGAILAPTDAALGAAVVNSPKLPIQIREALNVEAGLNDGLAVPFFTVFAALAADQLLGLGDFLGVTLEKIGYGVGIGVLAGMGGGWLLRECTRRGWMTLIHQQLALIALALVAWWVAEHVGGSGLIAAFVGGLTVGAVDRGVGEKVIDFTEDMGQFLSLLVFFSFGVAASGVLDQVTAAMVVYAVLSLTVLRMLPVAIALIGAGTGPATTLFLGWFGPRGLASVLLVLILATEQEGLPGIEPTFLVVTVTVLLSVLLHGATAAPVTDRFARRAEPSRR